MSAYNLGTGPGAIVSKFSGCPRDGFTCKKLGRESWVEAKTHFHFSFLAGPAGCVPRQASDVHWTSPRHTRRCRRTMHRCNRNVLVTDGPTHIL